MTREDNRTYCFDNLKFILIFLAVLGHLLKACPEWGGYNTQLYRAIYSFHMPAFIFVTGHFASYKKKNILRFAYIYLIFQTLHKCFTTPFIPEERFFDYFVTSYTLWYLMVYILYYMLIPYFDTPNKRTRIIILSISFIVSLIYGYDDSIGYFLSVGRLLSFFPFFLLGYYTKDIRQKLISIQNKTLKIYLTVFTAFLLTAFFVFCPYDKEVFFGSYAYSLYNFGIAEKLLLQITALIVTAFLIVVLCPLMNKKIPLITALGQNTLSIYLLHPIFVKLLQFSGLTPYIDPLLAFSITFLIILAFGNNFVSRLFSKVFSVDWILRLIKKA